MEAACLMGEAWGMLMVETCLMMKEGALVMLCLGAQLASLRWLVAEEEVLSSLSAPLGPFPSWSAWRGEMAAERRTLVSSSKMGAGQWREVARRGEVRMRGRVLELEAEKEEREWKGSRTELEGGKEEMM